jgi:hypothetical protein
MGLRYLCRAQPNSPPPTGGGPYVFKYFIAPSNGGTLGNDNNDGQHPTVTGIGNQGPWTIGSLFNPQTIGANAQQLANQALMAANPVVGIVGDQGVLSLADVGKTYPNGSGTGMVLMMANGSATQQSVLASCNSAGQYAPRLAVIDGGITTVMNNGALTTSATSSFYMIGRFSLSNNASDSQYCTIDGLEVRNCMGGGVVFGITAASVSPGWKALNNFVHHVYNANEGAQVVGSVVGGAPNVGVLTVTSVTNGSINPGDAIWNLSNGAGIAGLGAIQAYGTGGGTGTGGVGTYVLGVASSSFSGAMGITSYGGNNLAGISFHGGKNIDQENNYISDIIDLNNNVHAGGNRRATGIKNWTTQGGTVAFNTIYASATNGFPTSGISMKNVPQFDYVVAYNYINLANAGPYATEDVIGCAGDGEGTGVTAPDGHFAYWHNNIIVANPNGGWGVPGVIGGPSQSPLIVYWYNNTMVSAGAHGNIGRLGTKGATDQIYQYHDNIMDRVTANSAGNGGDWRWTSLSMVYIDYNLYPTNFVMVLKDATTGVATTYQNSPPLNGGLSACMTRLAADSGAGGTPTTGLEAHVQLGQALYVNASSATASGKRASDWQLAIGSPGKGQGTGGGDMGAWGNGATQIGCNWRDPSG